LPTLPPSPWREFLQALDAKVTEACKLPCFGGFAVTLAYGISRLTFDIDILDVAPPHAAEIQMREGGKGSHLAIEHKVYLDFVGIANPPYDYESQFKHFMIKVLCISAIPPWSNTLRQLDRSSSNYDNSPNHPTSCNEAA
jgi:hypothetical protein